MISKLKKFLVKREESPWIFFRVTFTLTWVFWVPAALINSGIDSKSVILLIFLGGAAGKLIPPIALPYLIYGKKV